MRTSMHHALIAGAVALASCALSGCMSRQLRSFQTHPGQDTMLIETYDTTDYVLWSDAEHVYWSCAEQDEHLQCTRRCGGGADLSCPDISIFGETNVR